TRALHRFHGVPPNIMKSHAEKVGETPLEGNPSRRFPFPRVSPVGKPTLSDSLGKTPLSTFNCGWDTSPERLRVFYDIHANEDHPARAPVLGPVGDVT